MTAEDLKTLGELLIERERAIDLLRAENERLRGIIETSKDELASKRVTIRGMKAELERLQEQLRNVQNVTDIIEPE